MVGAQGVPRASRPNECVVPSGWIHAPAGGWRPDGEERMRAYPHPFFADEVLGYGAGVVVRTMPVGSSPSPALAAPP